VGVKGVRQTCSHYQHHGEVKYEWALFYDGEPAMGGGYHRVQIATFDNFPAALGGFELMSQPYRPAKQNLRIERRVVGPWEVVQP
jgi:hypothetical protein